MTKADLSTTESRISKYSFLKKPASLSFFKIFAISIGVICCAASLSHGQATLTNQLRVVGIFNPERYADEHVDDFRFRQEQVLHWERLLGAYDLQNDRIGSAQLLSGLPGYNLLILPHIVAFTPAEREAILDFTRRGNGILLMGETGRYFFGEDNTTLTRELGLKFKDLDIQERTSWVSVLDGPSYLASGLPRMQTMSIAIQAPVVLSEAPETVAFWLDRSITNPNFEEFSKNISVASGRYGLGRFVWLGFAVNEVGGDINSSEAFHELFKSIYQYFRAVAHPEISPWPYPFTSAIIFSMDVEQHFGNIRAIDSIPNLPPITYFVLTNQAELYAGVLSDIIREPGSTAELSLHGDNHDVFRGQAPETQYNRMAHAAKVITRIGGEHPPGFRPPQELYDFYTIQAMQQAGYNYILADSSPDRAEPRIIGNRAEPLLIEVGDVDFIQFTMFNKDDIKMVVNRNWPDPESVYEEYVHDVRNVLDRESLHIANIHSHILATPEYVGVFERFIEHVRRNYNVWMANADMVANWWRRHNKVELIVSSSSRSHVEFRLENQGAASLEDLSIDIWLPEATDNISIRSVPRGLPISDYIMEGERVRMRVPLLKADELREYEITWAVYE